MLTGYMRVSTAGQSLELQRDALTPAGCERIHEDVCSGTVADRPGLGRALEVLRAGDALVVRKLDRIERSLAHVGALQERGIGLKVLTGGIDTTGPPGRLVFGLFADPTLGPERRAPVDGNPPFRPGKTLTGGQRHEAAAGGGVAPLQPLQGVAHGQAAHQALVEEQLLERRHARQPRPAAAPAQHVELQLAAVRHELGAHPVDHLAAI